MNSDITVPELDELIEDITKTIKQLRKYLPELDTRDAIEYADIYTRGLYEYVTECNLFGYSTALFDLGKVHSKLLKAIDELNKTVKYAKENPDYLKNPQNRPCLDCSSVETVEKYKKLIEELADSITLLVRRIYENLEYNCCSEKEISKYS
jgi:hypothetical protein